MTSLDAQTRWQKRFDMGEDEPLGNVIVTSDGGYIMTGSTGQSVYADAFLIKTDSEGDLQWSRIYDLPNMMTGGKYVRNTPDGGYMVFTSNGQGGNNIVLLKIDALGNIEWQQSYVDDATLGSIGDLIVTADGGYAFLSSQYTLDDMGEIVNRENFLYKLDALGNILWIHESGTESSDFANSLIETSDGNFVFTGNYVDTSSGWYYNNYLTQVDASGNEIWTQYYNNLQGTSSESANSLIATNDGGYLISGNVSQGGQQSFYIIKTDNLGNITWTKNMYSEQGGTYANSGIQTTDGNYVIYGRRDYFHATIVKLSPTGNVIWEREIPSLAAGLSIEETNDLGLIITGEWKDENLGYDPGDNIALIKMDGDGLFLPKAIAGNVFMDINASCSYDNGELGLNNILVQANASDGSIYYTNTDNEGNYFMSLDTGNYIVTSYINTPYMQPCQATYTASLDNPLVFDSTIVNMPMEVTAICPYLTVDVSSFALRECFDNIYYVDYCNEGTLETDAYIELSLQGLLSISDATVPFTGPDSNNVYTFDVGNVGVGECGGFNVNIQLPCDTLNAGAFLGKTLCVDAHIYPDSICGPVSDMWDGSSIEVTGECDQDSIRFRIRNIGSGDMQQSRGFYVIEDQIMFMQGDFQLLSGEMREMAFFADGGTFRLEAEQAEDHPGESNPSVALEGCGDMAPFSLGFINQYAQDDRNPFIASECREVTGSYDPNDKQGFPNGYGEEHYIENGTELEYLIRFQNTGTDTAFTVVIRDEISELFDLSSIQLGASSHTYDFQVIDRMVKFTFNNILLVDSLTNEPKSHGFIKFRINPIVDLPIGTVLENTAGIYFDFNAPIITNTTFHTIGENFVTVDLISTSLENEVSNNKIKAYPNPFVDEINFELEGDWKDVTFRVYDISGKTLHQQNINSNIFQFSGEGIANGMYFYTIQSEGMDIAKGKIMLLK